MYTIKQLADMVGVSPKTLRIYEQKGLLLPVKRSKSGYRLYDSASLEILRKICRLRRFQFTLTEIQELLALPNQILTDRLKIQVGKLISQAEQKKQEALLLDKKIQLTEEKNALLVVNMQNDFTYGCLGFAQAKELISPVSQFVNYAHQNHIPVFFLNDCHDDEDKQEFYIWGRHTLIGTQGANVCDDISSNSQDYMIDKHCYSGFWNTDLLLLLYRLQITHLLVIGLDSNICVLQTIADAFNYGFQVTLLSDLTAAQYVTDYHSSLTLIKNNFNTNLKSSSVIEF